MIYRSHIKKCYNNIKQHLKKTPLEYNKRLSNLYNCNVYLKREDLQHTRSFKLRGALNKINSLSDINKHHGIVCASAGNHAQGVVYAANIFDLQCDIFIPINTPSQKIKQIKHYSNDKT